MAKGGIYWMSLKVNLRNHDLWVKYFRCVEKAGSFVCFASSGKILWNAVFTWQDETKLNPELRRVAPTPPVEETTMLPSIHSFQTPLLRM